MPRRSRPKRARFSKTTDCLLSSDWIESNVEDAGVSQIWPLEAGAREQETGSTSSL